MGIIKGKKETTNASSLTIWSHRLDREFKDLFKDLPEGITLLEHNIDANGFCSAIFCCIIRNKKESGGDNLESDDRDLVVLEYDLSNKTKYPFSPPLIRVSTGIEFIPPKLRNQDQIILPYANDWTPTFTIASTITDLMKMIEEYNDDTDERPQIYLPNSVIDLTTLKGEKFPCRSQSEERNILNRFLVVNDQQILELEIYKPKQDRAVVISAHSVQDVGKLKFKRQQSITLSFSDGTQLSLFMPESFDCVSAIQEILKKYGVEGKKTSVRAVKNIDRANDRLALVEEKFQEFEQNPNVEIVEQVMDLMRDATESFAAIDDPRSQEVLSKIHKFLQRPDVTNILENRVKGSSKKAPSDSVQPAAKVEVIEFKFLESDLTDLADLDRMYSNFEQFMINEIPEEKSEANYEIPDKEIEIFQNLLCDAQREFADILMETDYKDICSFHLSFNLDELVTKT